ncbi:hypothetical protein ABRZ24_06695 [Brenneria populi]|uniref:Uncharacterized protein n=1 Tax=Brenneria populi TaxID=1505588 RepID=A0ABU6JP99_9GAMM|nr:hypothetical protein [Brenneria populi Li et al. 2015]
MNERTSYPFRISNRRVADFPTLGLLEKFVPGEWGVQLSPSCSLKPIWLNSIVYGEMLLGKNRYFAKNIGLSAYSHDDTDFAMVSSDKH